MKNQLRIISGEWKRRQLSFASIEGLRPTPDRVRETLFNWMMWDIQNANVLDVCTGSGALAFEALSRNAKHVCMIEPNLAQAKFLQKNIALLGAQARCTLHVNTAQVALHHTSGPFDLVFLDPPYNLNLWQSLAEQIDPMLPEGAFIYIEADRELNTLKLPSSWQQKKQLKAGIVRAGLYQKSTPI